MRIVAERERSASAIASSRVITKSAREHRVAQAVLGRSPAGPPVGTARTQRTERQDKSLGTEHRRQGPWAQAHEHHPSEQETRATNEHASSTYFVILVTPRRFTAVTIRGPRSSSGRVVDSPPHPRVMLLETGRLALESKCLGRVSLLLRTFPSRQTRRPRSSRAHFRSFLRLQPVRNEPTLSRFVDSIASRLEPSCRGAPPRLAPMVSFPTPSTTRVLHITEFTSRLLRTQATSTTGGHSGRAELGTEPNRPPTTPRTATKEHKHDVHTGSH